jgi:hypothetical protein
MGLFRILTVITRYNYKKKIFFSAQRCLELNFHYFYAFSTGPKYAE